MKVQDKDGEISKPNCWVGGAPKRVSDDKVSREERLRGRGGKHSKRGGEEK